MSTGVERARMILRILLAIVYLYVGIAHLRSPATFLAIIPPWVPFPYQVILFTGLCEIAGAIALMTTRLRKAAGVMLALYAVCVFPANIRHAVEGIAIGGKTLGWGYHGPRLLFQPVFVWWALYAGGVINWPFKGKAGLK
jgi:uncharacterized membrane protein